jgi:hypothetical protein
MENKPVVDAKFWIGLRNAVLLSIPIWLFIFWAGSALAQGQGNGPPDNRPPGGDVISGDVTGSIDSVIESNIDVNNVVDAAANANATIEAGAMQSGDQNVNMKSKSLALVNTMGDVDINDCRESEQFGTPVFSRQWIQLNPWCAAEVYDAKGLNDLAARTRCTIKEIRKLFDDDATCIVANTVQPAPPPPPPAPAPVDNDRDDELERRLEFQRTYTEELEARLEELAQRQPEQRTVVQQMPYLSADKRTKLAELRDE